MSQPGSPDPPPRGAGLNDPFSIVAYLLSGMLLFGGAGWLADRWLGTSWLVLVGVLVGTGLALYLIYLRLTA